MTSCSPHPNPFPETELPRALSEQSFGIVSYEVTVVSQLEATARVVLLEGNAITISLTTKGYELVHDSGEPGDATFETLDDLLQTTSGMYEKARYAALVNELSLLS